MRGLIDQALQENPFENKNGYLPTRLLDLQGGCDSDLRLVITHDDPELQMLDCMERKYVTLSYCWGLPDDAALQLKTTHTTLASHKSAIQLNKVPKTISDAIKLCRKLGIRYLWVDALCIIQDDQRDWTKESFQMFQIYSNSFITLCIIKGDSCLSGFLEASYTPPTVQVGFRSRINSSVTGCVYLRMILTPRDMLRTSGGRYGEHNIISEFPLFDLDIHGAAWATRGWTFQEEELSPRKLYFGEITFYVSSGNFCKTADGSDFIHQSYLRYSRGGYQVGEPEITLGSWYNLVEAYAQRKLSIQQDRFPALSALARSFGNGFPAQKYLAGLWASDLHRGLLWTSTSGMPFEKYSQALDTPYVAPSWSWASCPLNNPRWIRLAISRGEAYSEIALVHDDIVVDKGNPYGIVTSARLNLRGKIFKPPIAADGRIRVDHGKRSKVMGFLLEYVLWSENKEYIAHLVLDWDGDSTQHDDRGYPHGPIDQLALLLVSSAAINFSEKGIVFKDLEDLDAQLAAFRHPTNLGAYGLLVRPKAGAKNEFQKLGIWCSDKKDLGGKKFWKNISTQELTLV
jgi:hypothetical protein